MTDTLDYPTEEPFRRLSSAQSERLAILAEDYRARGEQATLIRERMLRLVGISVVVLGAIASVPSVDIAKHFDTSPAFWWCAPALLGILLAAFILDYATLNGIVYHRRDLETRINRVLGGRQVLHYESRFARHFYSLRTGDRGIRLMLVAQALAILGLYVGSVVISIYNLRKVVHRGSADSQVLLFLILYAGLGLFLVYGGFRATFHIKSLYRRWHPDTTVAPADTGGREGTERLRLWMSLLLDRPWDILTKSVFFIGAWGLGASLTGKSASWYQVLGLWFCLDVVINQAKYTINDVYDADRDARSTDIRSNVFAGLDRARLRLIALQAVARGIAGSVLAYLILDHNIWIPAAIFLLVPLQLVYDFTRTHFNKRAVLEWLNWFRNTYKPIQADSRREAVKSIHLRRLPHESMPPTDWTNRSIVLGIILALGYAIRVGAGFYVTGMSQDIVRLVAFSVWGGVLGLGLVTAFWSWEGAWYAQRPFAFGIPGRGEAERTPEWRHREQLYRSDIADSKAHALWCYTRLERSAARRPSLRRRWAPWELAWTVALVAAPLLTTWTFQGGPASDIRWYSALAVGVVAALAYLGLPLPDELQSVQPVTLGGLLVIGVAALEGYGPPQVPFEYCLLALLPVLLFAIQYTAGPWARMDQVCIRERWGSAIGTFKECALARLDLIFLPPSSPSSETGRRSR